MIKRATTHEEHVQRLGVAVTIENATISYENELLFLNANLDVAAKTVMGIIGPNGAGKSTLLKAIMGFTDIQSGSIQIFSRDNKTVTSDASYVPTRFTLDWNFPLTTYDFVAMGRYCNLKFGLFFTKRDRDKTLEALEMLQLMNKKNTPISQLTDSEKEFALIARAIAQDGRIMVIDEPFQINDPSSEKLISEIVLAEKSKGKTILIAHHNMMNIPKIFDTITLVNKGIIASGAVNDVLNETNLKRCYGANAIFNKELINMRNK